MTSSPLCFNTSTPEKRERVIKRTLHEYHGKNGHQNLTYRSTAESFEKRPIEITRNIPEPVVASSQHYYEVLQPEPQYEAAYMNVYLPRFIEVPIPIEYLDEATVYQSSQYLSQINEFTEKEGPSLHSIEEVAGNIKNHLGMNSAVDQSVYQEALRRSWYHNKMNVLNSPEKYEKMLR